MNEQGGKGKEYLHDMTKKRSTRRHGSNLAGYVTREAQRSYLPTFSQSSNLSGKPVRLRRSHGDEEGGGRGII